MKRGIVLILLIALLALSFFLTKQNSPTGLQIFQPQVTLIGGAGDCGISLTTPGETYELTSDIAVCAGSGININASGITLDCLGFDIIGDGGATAIISALPRENLTIRNCNINGFDVGMSFTVFTNNTLITNNTVQNISGTGVGISKSGDGHNNTITYNTVTTTTDAGISWGGTGETDLTVSHNTAHSNDLVGIAANSENATIYNNTLYNNSAAGGNVGALELIIRNNVLAYENIMHNNSDNGVIIASSGANNNFTFRNNIINGSGFYGISIGTDPGDTNILISNNQVYNNSKWLESFGNAGIRIIDSEAGTFVNNTVYENDMEGILIEDSNNIELTNNTIHNNTENGISATGTTNNNTIENNNINENEENGISITGTASNYFIIGNTASYNTLSGIIATISSGQISDNTMNNNLGTSTGMSLTFGAPISLGVFGDSCTTGAECASGECDDPDGDSTGTCDDGTCGAGQATPSTTACDAANDPNECSFFVDGFCSGLGCCDIMVSSIEIQELPEAEINITNNTANNNVGSGFNFVAFNNTNFINNTATNNTGHGFNFTDITNSDIEYNLADANGENGFEIAGSSDNLSINYNNATNNALTGFSILAGSILEFNWNRAENNLGPNTGGDLTVTETPPAPLGLFGDPCTTGAECASGECDDPDLNGAGVCDGTCGIGDTFPFLTACTLFGPDNNCAAFIDGFCTGLGCCDIITAGYEPTELPDATTNITNNIATGNNGTGWHFTGFTNTNFINNTATNNTGFGFDFEDVTQSHIDNTIATENDGGLQFNASSNNIINISYIDTIGEPGINLADASQNNTFINATITSTDDWIYVGAPPPALSSDNLFVNLKLNNSFATILFTQNITPPDPRTTDYNNINMSLAKVYLNSTELLEFNTTAHITMYSVSSTNVQVAFDDTTFATCSPPQCENFTLTGTTLDFDIISFTTYQVQGGGATGRSTGGSGSSSAGGVCPPSCLGLTPEERSRNLYCQQACLTTPVQETQAPTQQTQIQPEPKQQTKPTTVQTETTPQETKPIEKTIQEQQIETQYKTLTWIFYIIALLSLTIIWIYTHRKHLR